MGTNGHQWACNSARNRGPDTLRLDLNVPKAMQEEALEVIEKVCGMIQNECDTKVIEMVIEMVLELGDSHGSGILKHLKHLKYLLICR